MNANLKLNPVSGAFLKDAVSGDIKANVTWFKASESFFADGIRAEHVATSKSGGLQEVYDFVTNSIISGLPERYRKVIVADAKSLDDNQKLTRKEGQQRLGVYRSRLQKYLRALAIGAGEVEEPVKEETTVVAKLKIVLETAAKIVQGDSMPEGYDPVDMMKAINAALKLIK
jgi:hypothetical protein